MDYHRGPNPAGIPSGYLKGIGGIVIGAAFMVVILIGVPAARWFLAISIPLGLIVAGVLYLWHKRRPVKVEDIESPKRPLGL